MSVYTPKYSKTVTSRILRISCAKRYCLSFSRERDAEMCIIGKENMFFWSACFLHGLLHFQILANPDLLNWEAMVNIPLSVTANRMKNQLLMRPDLERTEESSGSRKEFAEAIRSLYMGKKSRKSDTIIVWIIG